MVRRKKEVPVAPPNCAAAGSKQFRLTYPYGFVDENGTHRFWRAGAIVHDSSEVALLRARAVHLEGD